MPKLSVTIITKDEQANIERAIKSVLFADEIVVVDSGSTDKTCEIAGEYTDRVIFNEWPGHVKQKQFAVDAAKHDWILSIDADEEISEPLADKIKKLFSTDLQVDAFNVNRRSFYLDRWIYHSGWYPDKRIRIFNRKKARWGGYDPHDWVQCDGDVKYINQDILHYPYKNISHHLSTINKYTTIMAEQLFRMGKRASILDLIFRPCLVFLKKMILKGAFLDGYPGLVIAYSTALSVLIKYVKLREMQKAESKG